MSPSRCTDPERPAWTRPPMVARGTVLYSDGQPVVMCASPGLAAWSLARDVLGQATDG